MSQSNAGLLRLFFGWGVVLLAPLAAGCSDMHKYWDRSPTAPELARDVTPPAVRVLAPSGPDPDRATPVTGETRVVIAAEDASGIARVDLHVGAAPAVAVPGPPWEYRWNTAELGEGTWHRLWAIAVDQAGNLAASDTVYARAFNRGPGVTLTEPAHGALVRGQIVATAEIASGAPAIDRVEFLADAAVAGTATAEPWRAALDTGALPPGDHFLIARAITTLGLIGVSPALRVRVNNAAPAVAIDFPPAGHRVAGQGTLWLAQDSLSASIFRSHEAVRAVSTASLRIDQVLAFERIGHHGLILHAGEVLVAGALQRQDGSL